MGSLKNAMLEGVASKKKKGGYSQQINPCDVNPGEDIFNYI